MNCNEARETMLVAELAELRAGTSDLGRHLGECRACGRMALAILDDTAALGAVLPLRRSRRRLRRVALVGIPIAAAAALVLTINTRRDDDVSPPRPSLPVVRQVSLTVGQGQRATVLKTTDPTVTVIWLSPGGTE